MDILEFDIVRRAAQFHIGEIPEPPHTQFNEMCSGVLCYRLRDRQDDNIDMILLYKGIQLLHGVNRDSIYGCTHNRRGNIKGGIHGKTGLGKVKIVQQGATKVAHADHDEMMVVVYAQNMADFRAQFFDIVAVALLSEFAKTAEVLPDLGGGDIHLLAQRMRGNANDTAAAQIRQLPVITGKAPDHGVGYVLFFQDDHSCSSGFVLLPC